MLPFHYKKSNILFEEVMKKALAVSILSTFILSTTIIPSYAILDKKADKNIFLG